MKISLIIYKKIKLTTLFLLKLGLLFFLYTNISMASDQTEQENMNGRLLMSLCAGYIEASSSGQMSKNDSNSYIRCEHYMQGLVEATVFYERMMFTVSGSHLFCLPKRVISTRQAIQVTNEYLKKHPEKLDSRGVVLVMESFLDAYACKSK